MMAGEENDRDLEDVQSMASEDIDALLDISEDEIDDRDDKNNGKGYDSVVSSWREKRLQELKRLNEVAIQTQSSMFGTYDILRNEKDVLSVTTSIPFVVVHFAHRDYRTCLIMDKHLEILSKKYPLTKFCKIYVEDAPFLVDRMHIRVLPCVIVFIDGFSKYRLLGFDEVGGHDQVETKNIEDWFNDKEVLKNPYLREKKTQIENSKNKPRHNNINNINDKE